MDIVFDSTCPREPTLFKIKCPWERNFIREVVSACQVGKAVQEAANPCLGIYYWRKLEEDLAEVVRVETCVGE